MAWEPSAIRRPTYTRTWEPLTISQSGAADDFPVGVTRIRDDAWLVKDTNTVQAFVEKPGCPYSLQGTELVDCRGREINPRPAGVAPENATPGPPYFDMLAGLCTWVYPPAGDVWVYFEPWPGSMPRYDANGNLIDDPQGELSRAKEALESWSARDNRLELAEQMIGPCEGRSVSRA